MTKFRLPSWNKNEENEDAEDMSIVDTMQRETRLVDSTGKIDALTDNDVTSKIIWTRKKNVTTVGSLDLM
jgi:hypothetical protein